MALDVALEKAQKGMMGKKPQPNPTAENALKLKDRELQNQGQMIANLKKDNATLRSKMDTEVGLDKLMKYENANFHTGQQKSRRTDRIFKYWLQSNG